MKRRFIAIALSLALAAPLAGHADLLTVQAETADEAGQDPSDVSDSNSDSDPDGTSETDKDSDKDADKDSGKDSKGEGKDSEGAGKDAADPDQTDKDKDPDSSESDKDVKDTDKDKESESDTDEKTGDETDAAAKAFDVEIQQMNALDGISLMRSNANDLPSVADDSGLVVPETPDMTDLEYKIYFYLAEPDTGVQRVANGEISSTEFKIPLTREEAQQLDDLYQKEPPAGDTREFTTYIRAVVYQLYYAHPEYFYWWDDSCLCYPWVDNEDEDGSYLYLAFDVGTDICLNGDTYALDPAHVAAARKAMQNAAAIVENADNMGLYEALTFFKERICGLVTYQKNPGKNVSAPYNMIYVFDLDPNTNVVCEGYSKAFKYLFDLWSARHEDKARGFKCYLVDGALVHETPEKDGPHMWNMIYNPTGASNYVVDITNCDEGEDGYPDHLFMKNPTSVSTGTWAGVDDRTTGYVLDCGTYDYGHFELTYSYYTSRVKNTTDTLRGYSRYQTDVSMELYQDPSELDSSSSSTD